MARRNATVMTLLMLVALQLLGAIALSAVCLEPCDDDEGSGSCPPVCTLCARCAHAQQAIVQREDGGALVTAAQRDDAQQRWGRSSQLAADIFHVPLAG